jgi:hypothetical protein
MRHVSCLVGRLVLASLLLAAAAVADEPPQGFTTLFNGRDLAGWRGRPQLDPQKEAATPADERSRLQEEWNRDLAMHWSVTDGVIANDGKGVYLTTDRDYGDFEFLLDWRLPEPCVDSGVYLRGIPQVQIWDPACERDLKHGCEKGSGGLWNNRQWRNMPLTLADRRPGQWNTFFIRMVGEKVSVWLNDQKVVDDARMENYYDRAVPVPEKGPIQLQTHGGEIRWRNVFIRELPVATK